MNKFIVALIVILGTTQLLAATIIKPFFMLEISEGIDKIGFNVTDGVKIEEYRKYAIGFYQNVVKNGGKGCLEQVSSLKTVLNNINSGIGPDLTPILKPLQDDKKNDDYMLTEIMMKATYNKNKCTLYYNLSTKLMNKNHKFISGDDTGRKSRDIQMTKVSDELTIQTLKEITNELVQDVLVRKSGVVEPKPTGNKLFDDLLKIRVTN